MVNSTEPFSSRAWATIMGFSGGRLHTKPVFIPVMSVLKDSLPCPDGTRPATWILQLAQQLGEMPNESLAAYTATAAGRHAHICARSPAPVDTHFTIQATGALAAEAEGNAFAQSKLEDIVQVIAERGESDPWDVCPCCCAAKFETALETEELAMRYFIVELQCSGLGPTFHLSLSYSDE